MVEWRPVADWDRYEVSDDGRVRNHETKEELVQRVTTNGYMAVSLYRRGVKGGRQVRVHRLVATAFLRPPESDEMVNHIDHNRVNNHLGNLEWVTGLENQSQALAAGRYHAATNPNRIRKFAPSLLAECRARLLAGESGVALASEYGISTPTIYRLRHGRDQRGMTAGMAVTKMTAEVAGRIKGLHAAGFCKSECARWVGVTPAIAGRVLNGVRWKDAPLIPFTDDEAPPPGVRRKRIRKPKVLVAPRKLNPAKVIELRAMRASGAAVAECAKAFGLSRKYTYRVLGGGSWANLPIDPAAEKE